MSRDGTYGDHFVLQALAEALRVQILVVSTLNGGTTLLSPNGDNVFHPHQQVLVLGHFAETHGIHYVSLVHSENEILDIVQRSPQITLEEPQTLSSEIQQPSNEVSLPTIVPNCFPLLSLPIELAEIILKLAIDGNGVQYQMVTEIPQLKGIVDRGLFESSFTLMKKRRKSSTSRETLSFSSQFVRYQRTLEGAAAQ